MLLEERERLRKIVDLLDFDMKIADSRRTMLERVSEARLELIKIVEGIK